MKDQRRSDGRRRLAEHSAYFRHGNPSAGRETRLATPSYCLTFEDGASSKFARRSIIGRRRWVRRNALVGLVSVPPR